jgi:hypothetical protein
MPATAKRSTYLLVANVPPCSSGESIREYDRKNVPVQSGAWVGY